MEEIKFETGVLRDGTRYEWAKRQDGVRVDLILHFFLGTGKPVANFFDALRKAAMECVSDEYGGETSYTEEMDGHDMIVFGIEGWKAKAIANSIINHINSGLDGAK